MSLPDLLKTQISLSEWFEKMGYERAKEFRDEDNEKRERLKVLKEHIGLPFDEPFQCMARDVVENTPLFLEYLERHGDELCAMRLIPLDPSLPKLRMRGQSVRDVSSKWFPDQSIDPSKYRVDFIPHPTTHLWSTIFVVNHSGIFGEVIVDSHEQLTQGFYREQAPVVFSYDFNTFQVSDNVPGALEEAQATLAHLYVPDKATQQALTQALGAVFANDHLCGYFESVNTADFGRWFIDYNRILGDVYRNTALQIRSAQNELAVLRGQCGSPGTVTGNVHIVSPEAITTTSLSPNDILVCDMTSPDYLPLIMQAAAIVTNRGGVLSHAAIVCRELGKPCVVGTREATTLLKDGEMIEVYATRGTIKRDIV